MIAISSILLISSVYGSKYVHVRTNQNWWDGEAYCNSIGSNLASIHSAADMADAVQACGDWTCYIGLTDQNGEGTWEWSDGTPTDYGFLNNDGSQPNAGQFPWHPNSPQDAAFEDQDCIELIGAAEGAQFWEDWGCDHLHDVLCNVPYDAPPFETGPNPLGCKAANKYCKDVFGTQLATIATDDDRADAISLLGSGVTAWMGLYSGEDSTNWRFRSGDDCPADSNYKCVDFWLYQKNALTEFRPRCIGPSENGHTCAIFDTSDNGVDNNVDINTQLPFLCDAPEMNEV